MGMISIVPFEICFLTQYQQLQISKNFFLLANGPVAQLVEQRCALREVVSSTLAGPTLRVLK